MTTQLSVPLHFHKFDCKKGYDVDIFRGDVNIKFWKTGDPVPVFGEEVGIDTETDLITDTNLTPPLVVMGVYNPLDNTCYVADYASALDFIKEIAVRNITIYLANAGFDYYELWCEELQEAASPSRNNVVDIFMRAAIKEVGSIGYIHTRDLKNACKRYLEYEMDKHEDEGEASLRINFRRDVPVTEDQYKYLAIDCATTYYVAKVIGPQPTEHSMTRGQICLYHIQKNGFAVDNEMLEYCEDLLTNKMEEYRLQLISFGFPDPLKKKEAKEIEIFEEHWPAFIQAWASTFIKDSYSLPKQLPSRVTCRRIFLYLYRGLLLKTSKADTVRIILAILIQNKASLTKVEKSYFDNLSEDVDFIAACDAVSKREVWPLLIKYFLEAFVEYSELDKVLEVVDEKVQEHSDWFCQEAPVKPTTFLQNKLHELQDTYKGLVFDKTEATGALKCSKTDSWKLEDAGCEDQFLLAYNNFVHVQKYKSTFVNRSHIKSDGKVHARYGIVNTLRSNCVKPNMQQYPSKDKEFPLKNMFRPPHGTILVSTDYSFAELVSLAQCCYTKYGYSVLRDIINADVCPHYFFAGVMKKLITADISFCKDPEAVKDMKAFLKANVTSAERSKAKGVNFGLPGMMGNERLYVHLRTSGIKVTRAEAANLKRSWLNTFPEMQQHFNRTPIKEDSKTIYNFNTLDEGEEEGEVSKERFKVKTITGFVRNRATINAACNTDFQHPVAVVAKEGLWNMEECGLGHRFLNFVHDEVNWWAYPEEVFTLVPFVENIWLEPGKRLFPDVKLKCETSLSLYWDKEGVEFTKVQWDENNIPILDVPDFVKQVKEKTWQKN